ncbi:hypothetical protein BDF20DRAFT_945371 [Mycotypha africana]|uniref:uncharacterized protein n=1 Tax=Mycotypha africana TaxID=64632 RepID=UPI00230081F6|nr:uncharacterized protein BDF20DRAFT_945371 [Mycotypha africana]KAI8973178.1 hypothetical protein BDF20DRAFT_945371 [Mycotypha africana]
MSDSELDKTPIATKRARESSVGEEIEQCMVEKIEQHSSANSEVLVEPKDHVYIVTELQKQHLNDGELWCLISKDWWNRWTKYCARLNSPSSSARRLGESTPPGPIDNRPILNDNNDLKEGLTYMANVTAVPEQAWNRLVSWYGTMNPEMNKPIRRAIITQGCGDNERKPTVELYPPQFKVYMVETTNKSANHQQISGLITRSPVITLSTTNTAQDFCNAIRDAFDLSVDAEVQYWLLQDEPAMASCPNVAVEVLKNAQKLTVDSDDSKLNCSGKFYIAIEVKNRLTGCFPSDTMEATQTQQPSPSDTASDISSTSSVFANGFNNLSTSVSTTATTPHSIQRFKPGVCGLQNLGNTCFMNSALQCLSNTEELTKWFLADNYKKDLNRDNPLGMKGQVAEAYGELIEKLWGASTRHVAPRDFKYTIGRFNSSFSGYQQHDTQELLAFLLDGLHEDLNRILKKPYIELPDFHDMEDAEIAQQSWDYHKARNDSIIVDLFQGQFKSKLVCDECKNVSVTFDPFMYLSLPLPIKKKSKTSIVYVPYDPSQKLQRVVVTLSKEASIAHLQKEVARMFSVEDPNSLLVVELFSHKIYKIFAQYEPVASIGASDIIYVYQLPGPIPPAPKKRSQYSYRSSILSDDEKSDDDISAIDENQLIVFPVYCATVVKAESAYASERINQFGDPIILAVPYKDACNKSVEFFYQLLSEHIERYTQSKPFEEVKDEDEEADFPEDIVTDESKKLNDDETPSEPIDQQSPPSYESVMEDQKATDLVTNENTMPESSVDFDEKSEMDIDEEEADRDKEIDSIETDAAIMSTKDKQVERINNLFTMKIFSNTRYSRYGNEDLLPLVQSFTGLIDFRERTETEQAQREEYYKLQNGFTTEAETEQQIQHDVEMVESPSPAAHQTPVAGDLAIETVEADDQVENAAAIFGLTSTSVDSSISSSLVNIDDKVEPGEILNDNDTISSIDNASVVAAPDGNLSPLISSPTLEYQPSSPPAADILKKLPKRKVSCPPDTIIRQGEGILLTWTPKRAQQLFGATNSSGNGRNGYSYSYSNSDNAGVCTDAWEDIDDLGDPNEEDTDITTKKKQVTLSDCLDEFTKEEELSEEDLWYCPKCKKHQRATKKFDLWRMPEIMVVHLKRFSHSRTFRDKIDAFIDFPTEGLDLTDRVLSTRAIINEDEENADNRLIYDLYAVDNHYGGLGGGHYTSFAQNFEDGRWYNFDDSHVSEVAVDDAKTAAAYLLFYKRRRSKKANSKSVEEIIQDKISIQRQQQAAETIETVNMGMEKEIPVVRSSTLPNDPEENYNNDDDSTIKKLEEPDHNVTTISSSTTTSNTNSPVVIPYKLSTDENAEDSNHDEQI